MKKLSKNEVEKKLKLLSKNWVLKDNILFAKFKFITFDDAFDFMKIVSEKCKDLNPIQNGQMFTTKLMLNYLLMIWGGYLILILS